MSIGPFELPEGWKWVKLGEIVREIQPGFAYGKKKTVGGELLHIRPYNIGIDGELTLTQKVHIPYINIEENLTWLEPGDVLFNNTNSVELVGKTALVREPLRAAWSNHVTRLRPDLSKCEPGWLALSLRVLWLQGFFAQRCNKWIGQAGFNTAALKAIEIPLPPLPEQKRIVAKIEALMERIRRAKKLREETKRDTEKLWQSALAETFPRPGADLPKGWKWVKLGEVCEHKTGIWGPPSPDDEKGFPVIRSTEIVGYRIEPQGASIRLITSEKIKDYILQSGDILINKSSGSPHLVGWPAIFEDPDDGRVYLFSNFMLRLRVDQKQAFPWFVLYYLHSHGARSFYLRTQNTTSGLRNLQVKEFLKQPIPLPPLPEQKRIVNQLEALQDKIKALKEAQKETEEELKRLEQSILEKAFRGQL